MPSAKGCSIRSGSGERRSEAHQSLSLRYNHKVASQPVQLSLAHNSISTKVSAQTRTALTGGTKNSTKLSSTFSAWRGSCIGANTSANHNRPGVSIFSPGNGRPNYHFTDAYQQQMQNLLR